MVKSIQEDFQCGSGGAATSPESLRKRALPEKDCGKTKCRKEIEEDLQETAERNAIRDYLAKLSPEDRELLETEALAQAEPLLAEGYRRSLEGESEQLLREYREMIIKAHVRKLLGLQAKESPPGRA